MLDNNSIFLTEILDLIVSFCDKGNLKELQKKKKCKPSAAEKGQGKLQSSEQFLFLTSIKFR